MGVEVHPVSDGVVVGVFVKSNSKRFELRVDGDGLVVLCRESPVKGGVNKELIKELLRIFKRRVEVVAGFTSRQKKVLSNGISVDEANSILTKYASKQCYVEFTAVRICVLVSVDVPLVPPPSNVVRA